MTAATIRGGKKIVIDFPVGMSFARALKIAQKSIANKDIDSDVEAKSILSSDASYFHVVIKVV